MNTPAWLNNEYFKEILIKDGEEEPMEVVKVILENATLKGESFLSYTAHITVQYKHLSDQDSKVLEKFFFVKLYDLENYVVNVLKGMGLYDREHELYEKVFPHIKSLLGSSSNLTPEFFKAEEKCLIMRDLSKDGYCVMKRQSQLDYNHSLAVLRCLAKFHAASFTIKSKYSDFQEKYKPLYIVRGNENVFSIHYGSSFCSAATAVGKWPGYEKYEQKLRASYERLFEQLLKLHEEDQYHLSVLNHGDLWVNNLLFKHDKLTGEIIDLKFIDFQHSAVGRPTRDLHYFIFSSVQEEIREKYLDFMLKEYHRTFTSTLGELGFSDSQFTFQELKNDFERTLILGLVSATVVLPAVLQDNDEATDFLNSLDEEMLSSETVIQLKGPHSCESFKKQYQKMLVYFEKKGIL